VAARPLGPTLNTNAIVDIVSLPDGIHALHQDKKRFMIASLVLLRQLRPWITKVEFKYIERYVKIEKPVATIHKEHSSLSRSLTTLWLLTSNGDLTTPKVLKWQW